MPRGQLMVILALALMCGVAAGVFVYFMAAAPRAAPTPPPVAPVRVANPSPPSTVMLPTQRVVDHEAAPAAPAPTKMKPPTMDAAMVAAPVTSAMGGSAAQRVRHARRQCHAMAERLCQCFPQTCSQQRDAQRNADRQLAESVRRLQSMPGPLNELLTSLEQSCRDTYAATQRAMPQCF